MEQSAGVLKALGMSEWEIIRPPLGAILDICFGETHGEELKELLGPSVYAGIVENRYPELLTSQLEIIADVTRMDIKFWTKLHERKSPILDLYAIASNSKSLYERVKEMAKGKNIKLILPDADNLMNHQSPVDVVLAADPGHDNLEMALYDPVLKINWVVNLKGRDTYSHLADCDQDNLHVILGMFVLNAGKAKAFGIILADDLQDVWNRAKEIYIGPGRHSNSRMVAELIQTLILEQSLAKEESGDDTQTPDLFERMKTFNRVINNLVVANRLTKNKG